MKKIIILSFLSVLAIQLRAQGTKEFNAPGNVYITPKIGYNMANVSKIKSDPRHGVNVGISLEYMITKDFSIEPGLYYSMQGASWKLDDSNLGFLEKITGSAKATLKNDYINVPILLKYYVADGFHIFAGPQLGYLVNTSVGGSASAFGFSINSKDVGNFGNYIKDKEKKFDFAVAIGAGYQDPSGFLISASYNIGITKLFELNLGDVGNYNIDYKARNNVLQINLGYRF